MDWNKGFEAKYYCSFVDKGTWRDLDRFEITGGQVTHSNSELLESADIETSNYIQGERWIRLWLYARQNGATEHIPMFTGLATSPSDDVDGNLVSNSLECYSVLKPLKDVLLPRGWYAPAKSGESLLRDLLSVTPAPVEVEDNIPTLKHHIIAESGETNLSMLNKILLAIDWRMKISGDGTIKICPYSSEICGEFDLDNDSVEPHFIKSYDWFDCPNVFRAVTEDETAVAIDDSENSPMSTINRGREIWAEETSCNLNSDETLYEYAVRRLKESQMVGEKISYDRRYNPNVYITDLVRFNYPQINGTYLVTSQSIEIGYGAKTTEEAIR